MCVSGRWPKTLKSAITGTAATRLISPRRIQTSYWRPSRSRSRFRTIASGISGIRRRSGAVVRFLLAVGPDDQAAAGYDERAQDHEHDHERVASAAGSRRGRNVLRALRCDRLVLVDGAAVSIGVGIGEERLVLVGPDQPEPRADQPAEQLRAADRAAPDGSGPRAGAGRPEEMDDRRRRGRDIEIRLPAAFRVDLEAERLPVPEDAREGDGLPTG